MGSQSIVRWCLCLSVCAISCTQLAAADQKPAERSDFQDQIAPLLKEHCAACHNAEDAESGLNLTTRAAVLGGSKAGPVVTPGRPAKSRLIEVLAKEARPHMPPDTQLSARDIGKLREWIARLDRNTHVGRSATFSDEVLNHWSFQPLVRPPVAAVVTASRSRGGIDRFVEARLAAEGLALNAPADRETLARRLHFDLIGLPPTPAELNQFVEDTAPGAYERMVDRLLASPHYGERWGRHWLDLARYADSSGFHSDLDRPHAWRYRDYVIRSFNEDRSYGEFIRQQLAGDEKPHADLEDWIATGFCRNGPSNDDNMGKTPLALEQYRLNELDDVISTTSNVFLGLTLGCARCHDHKYDPLAQRDYYRFLAYFNGSTKKNILIKDYSPAAPKFGPTNPKRTLPAAMVFTDYSQKPRETHLLWRGQVGNKGPRVTAGTPKFLARFSLPPRTKSETRLELAEWIASPENPLTWRVMANRLWQHHFGRGLVTTPSNFGLLGARPSHPELLDYLADELRRNRGHVKPLHRLIVTSATYRQSSRSDAEGIVKDPENILLWRQNKQRMDAEVLRDSILAVAGSLNSKQGGPGIKPRIRAELLVASQRNKWPHVVQEGPEHWRRSVYIYVKRQLQLPMLELFDAPSTNHSCARRAESLVPTQALVLMNDQFVWDQAAIFTERVSLIESDHHARVAVALRLALNREPTSQRVAEGVLFLKRQTERLIAAGATRDVAQQLALTDFCHVIFNLSEFVYID